MTIQPCCGGRICKKMIRCVCNSTRRRPAPANPPALLVVVCWPAWPGPRQQPPQSRLAGEDRVTATRAVPLLRCRFLHGWKKHISYSLAIKSRPISSPAGIGRKKRKRRKRRKKEKKKSLFVPPPPISLFSLSPSVACSSASGRISSLGKIIANSSPNHSHSRTLTAKMTLARWTALLSAVALAAAKVQWDAPTSTLPNAGPFGYGVMPRPTAAPAYTNAHALRKRASSDQLCGYISSVSRTSGPFLSSNVVLLDPPPSLTVSSPWQWPSSSEISLLSSTPALPPASVLTPADNRITCASSFSCTRHSSLSVLGCCYGPEYCAFDTTCLDSTACNSQCMQSTGSLTLVWSVPSSSPPCPRH